MIKKSVFQKTVLIALTFALVLAAFPLTNAFAAGQANPPQPPTGVSNDRLERIWGRMLNRYDRLSNLFDNDNKLTDHAEKMIARLKEAGKPTAELETSLSAFEEAVKKARPIYESCKGIIHSHMGFDANGKVTDGTLARETARDLAAKMKEIHETMNGTGKALAELMKSIREQNAPAPTPTSGS